MQVLAIFRRKVVHTSSGGVVYWFNYSKRKARPAREHRRRDAEWASRASIMAPCELPPPSSVARTNLRESEDVNGVSAAASAEGATSSSRFSNLSRISLFFPHLVFSWCTTSILVSFALFFFFIYRQRDSEYFNRNVKKIESEKNQRNKTILFALTSSWFLGIRKIHATSTGICLRKKISNIKIVIKLSRRKK